MTMNSTLSHTSLPSSQCQMAENLVERFSREVQAAEAHCFYGFQILMYVSHIVGCCGLVWLFMS
jgi:hypothetical protein